MGALFYMKSAKCLLVLKVRERQKSGIAHKDEICLVNRCLVKKFFQFACISSPLRMHLPPSVSEITCVFLRLSMPWVLSIKSFQLCVFIKIELLWLSYDKICWPTNLRPLSWVATSWWTLSVSRHWWRTFLFFWRCFCVWHNQKEFYVKKILSMLGFGAPFTKKHLCI